MSARRKLRELLARRNLLIAPGAFDGLSARLVEQAGFEAVYLSGGAVARSAALPDLGLMTMSEVIERARQVVAAVKIPVVADADTGYGNALSVVRTVREFERAGVAAIHIEDQVTPKRCGHLDGKALVSAAEMAGKLRAALDARHQALIMARSDAIAVEGLEAALERGERYLEAGIDVLFIEAPQSEAQMKAVTARFAKRVPLLANMVEGGKTPILDAKSLAELGYRIAIFPGGLARFLARSAQDYFAALKRDGTTAALRERMLDFDGLNRIIGTPQMLELGKRYEK
jgi:2-methylisocitrate lyase-like PEP mutase family enzyme